MSSLRRSSSILFDDQDIYAVKTLKKSQSGVGDKVIPNEILNLIKIGLAAKELCSEQALI